MDSFLFAFTHERRIKMDWWVFLIVWFACSTLVFVLYNKAHADKVEKTPVLFSLACLFMGPVILVLGIFAGIGELIQKRMEK